MSRPAPPTRFSVPAPATVPELSKPNLLGLTLAQLTETVGDVVDRPYRVRQIYDALYRRGVRDFSAMTDLSKQLRSSLAGRYSIGLPEIESTRCSRDGTVKHLFVLADEATIETVDIPDGDRRTLCLSSQAGCALGCRFCVTGYWGAGRNLTAGEIVGQVLAVASRDRRADRGLNLVFMGMGEPLLNLGSLHDALMILAESISWRRMTVSTAGVVPGIEDLGRWPKRPNLAVSLHAPDDERRSQLMPINRKYPLAELLSALREYPLERGRRLTFEYTLIRGFNDSADDARKVARLLRGLRAKVNLIPLNPDPVLDAWMEPPEREAVAEFRRILIQEGVSGSVRRPRGDDVGAACGQLRAHGREPRGARAIQRGEAAGASQIKDQLRPAQAPSRR